MKRLAWLLLLAPKMAWAGGFEFPANGTEALARGGAFTAKADSPLALEYNPAGLARQRGTRVLIDSNLTFGTMEYTRFGVYPGNAGDPNTPFAGQRYPTISNGYTSPFYAPFLGIASDLGIFDRWTFAVGVYGPSAFGKHYFPEMVTLANGMTAPAPQRYDLTNADLLIVYPTLAAAVRVTHWLDVGVALHLVYGHFDLANIAIADTGPGTCRTPEYPNCDARNHINLNGFTAAASFGVMARPIPRLQLGLDLRTPVYLDATGPIDSPGSKAAALQMPLTGNVLDFKTPLPLVLRVGGRWRFLGGDGFEHGDLELDVTYEGWGWVQNPGIELNIDMIGFLPGFKTILKHNYKDTVGVRLGGAYNLRLKQGVLSFRAGAFYDSAATDPKDTRVDFETMDKVAGTFGLGYEIRGVRINLAYAYIWSPDRNVTNGDLQPLNGQNGTSSDSRGNPFAPINSGFYHNAFQILSFGVDVVWDTLLKKHRVIRYD